MNLSDGKYLGHEICAFSGNGKSMWLVVWDGKYNYYLFDSNRERAIDQYNIGRLPGNQCCYVSKVGILKGASKRCEFYTSFDNAVKNLCKVKANDGFINFTKVLK